MTLPIIIIKTFEEEIIMLSNLKDIIEIIVAEHNSEVDENSLVEIESGNMAILSKFTVAVNVEVVGDEVKADISSVTSLTNQFSDMTVVNYIMSSIAVAIKNTRTDQYICIKHNGSKMILDLTNMTYEDESGKRRFSDSQGFWSISVCHGTKQCNVPIYRLVAYLNEILTGKVRLSYDGLAVNHKRNDKFLKSELLSSCNLEITDIGSNSRHGHVWNKIKNECGVRTWFSAENQQFIDYIKSINKVTIQHLVSYGGFVMDGYWVVI